MSDPQSNAESSWLTLLQLIHEAAGRPSVRTLAAATGVSTSTVADTLAGRRTPSWRILESLTNALNGDLGQMRDSWKASVTRVPDLRAAERDLEPLVAYRDVFLQMGASLERLGVWHSLEHLQDSQHFVLELLGSAQQDEAGQPSTRVVKSIDDVAHRALLLGPAGSGKSSLAGWLAYREATEGSKRFPYVVQAAQYLSTTRMSAISIPGYLADKIQSYYQVQVSEEEIRKSLSSGNAFLILDGLDEVVNPVRSVIFDRLTSLMHLYPRSRYLVTSREAPEMLSESGPLGWTVYTLQDSKTLSNASFWPFIYNNSRAGEPGPKGGSNVLNDNSGSTDDLHVELRQLERPLAITGNRDAVSPSQPAAAQPPLRVFVSYARVDDEALGFVQPFAEKLKTFVRMLSARDLDVTVDVTSVAWGQSWREALFSAVEAAGVFIPMITGNYLRSTHCRDEFLAFRDKAQSLGVSELLLPILPLGSGQLFIENAEDEIIALVAERQQLTLQDVILEGYDSPAWRVKMIDIAKRFLAAVSAAEQELEALGKARDDERLEQGHSDEASSKANEEEEEGLLLELVESLNVAIESMVEEASHLAPALEGLTGSDDLMTPPTPGDRRALLTWSQRLADHFSEPAQELERRGQGLRVAVTQANQALIALREFANRFDDPDVRGDLLKNLRDLIVEIDADTMTQVADQMDELLSVLRMPEQLSQPIRRALRPARAGLVAVQDSVRTVRTWPELVKAE